ncbi:MAG: phosphoribosylamine--glycine ligase [Verrucomicrobia bacterium]|nr:phosphoribosylamine--glycine ligase [Verrucomicrobiota bacterium]
MNLLVIGGGGREHALAWKLAQSPRVSQIFCAPGNAGTARLGARNLQGLKITDVAGLLAAAREHRIEFTVVGPDDALAAGVVDAFLAAGLPIFGPTQAAAQLESSKIFTKEFFGRHKIPTAAAGSFARSLDAFAFCRDKNYPLVIKADGLATGKGVIIAHNPSDAAAALHDIMDERRFGDAGQRVLIEEYLVGRECSLHALLDGRGHYQLWPAAQDYKRALDGDIGPNTGGMGTTSPPVELFDAETEARIRREIMDPLVAGLVEESIDFRGLLFPGLMLTNEGPKVLELNARFGDPETQVLLPRLRGDLLPALEAVAAGQLEKIPPLAFDPRPAVCVILASGGYPDEYSTGFPITGLDADFGADVQIFHAGTRLADDAKSVLTAGGRVLGVSALGDTLADARARAYDAAAHIRFEGRHLRHDIGSATGG